MQKTDVVRMCLRVRLMFFLFLKKKKKKKETKQNEKKNKKKFYGITQNEFLFSALFFPSESHVCQTSCCIGVVQSS